MTIAEIQSIEKIVVWLTDGTFAVKKVEGDMDSQTESRQKEEI